MFGKKFAAYRQNKNKAHKQYQALLAAVHKTLSPYRHFFDDAIYFALTRMEDGFVQHLEYQLPQEAYENLTVAILATSIPNELHLNEADISYTVHDTRYDDILKRTINKKLSRPGLPSISLDGLAVAHTIDPDKLFKTYLEAVAKNLLVELKERTQKNKAAFDTKYNIMPSTNKEPVARIGKLSTSVVANR